VKLPPSTPLKEALIEAMRRMREWKPEDSPSVFWVEGVQFTKSVGDDTYYYVDSSYARSVIAKHRKEVDRLSRPKRKRK
jgi:hypothetical protein